MANSIRGPKPVQLGGISVPPLWMAPMAGVTDKPFRGLLREKGCGLAFTEMVSGKAIQYGNRRTWRMMDIEGEQPIGVQLFGSDPVIMAQAAKAAQAEGADVIDINMGCPVPKVVGNGEGAALLTNPQQAVNIASAVVDAVSVPVTVKIRAGWDQNSRNAVSLARELAQCGLAAITVHGRTREQMYSGSADWSVIGQVVKAISIPVIGNGDIWDGKAARDMLSQTGCQGIMLARGVLGNPWLFEETVAELSGEEYIPPTMQQRIQFAIRHLLLEVEYRSERAAVLFMRKHLAWYLKGLPATAGLKKEIFRLTSSQAMVKLLNEYVNSVD